MDIENRHLNINGSSSAPASRQASNATSHQSSKPASASSRQVSFAPTSSTNDRKPSGKCGYDQLIRYEEDAAEEELEKAGLITPPDGGYGWLVVAGSFLAHVIVDGVNFTAGQGFLSAWEEKFSATSGQTAWVVSILTGINLLVGPVVSALANEYGCRATTIAGTLIACLGFALSIFAPNLPVLYLTFGVMGGFGFGLVYLPAVVIVSYYFETKRALATGIAVCGSGIGMFIFSPLIEFCMQNLGLSATLAVLSGVCGLTILSGLVFSPLEATDSQIDEVAEIAMRTAHLSISLEDLNQDVIIPPETPLVNIVAPIATEETHESPHVEEGIKIERFDRRKSSIGLVNRRTPFKSAIELRAKKRMSMVPPTNAKDPAAAQAYYRMASKETMNTLNKPFSRADIFYPGSMRFLNERNQHHLQIDNRRRISRACSLPRMSLVAISRLSLSPSATAGMTWRSNMKSVISSMVDMKLLAQPAFILMTFASSLAMFGVIVPFIYLRRQALVVGIPASQATTLVSLLGVVNIVARIACGWLSDHPKLNVLTINSFAVFIGGAATIAVPYFTEYWHFIAYCIVFGSSTACFGSMRSIICVELFGIENLTNAFGFLMMFMGVAALVGTPVAGTLFDMTGNYDVSFYTMGVCIAVSGLLGFMLKSINKWECHRKAEEEPEVQAVSFSDDEDDTDFSKWYTSNDDQFDVPPVVENKLQVVHEILSSGDDSSV